MSNKFTTLVTNEGINLLQASSQQDKKIEFVKAIGSSTAYSTSQLSTVTYADVMARAAKNQEGTVNNIVPDKTTTKMELLFDGHDVKSDYTLNSIFIIARLKDSSDYKVFAILKANQPQYINAYTGDGATNLQINVGVKFDNQDNVSLEINSAALATMGDLQNLSKSTAEKLASENTRATESEQALDKLIEAETKRASNAESTLRSETTAESNRAKGVENELDNKIASETTRATKSENNLAGKITSEQNRAMAKENSLDGKISQVQTNLNAEQGRATGAEQKLDGRVDSEIARATKAESDIQNQVNAEKSRATAAEGNLNKTITDESNRAKGAESSLSGKVDSETARATKAENDLAGKITSEQNRAIAKENDLDGKIQSVKGSLDWMKFGGWNMLNGTSDQLRSLSGSTWMWLHTWTNNDNNTSKVSLSNLQVGDWITYSVWVANDSDVDVVPEVAVFNKDLTVWQGLRGNIIKARQSGWAVRSVQLGSNDWYVRPSIITTNGQPGTHVVRMKKEMLTVGNVKLDWGPSAKDIENMVSDAENTLRSETTAEANRAKGVENELRNLANSNRDRLNAKDNQIVIENKDEAIKDLIAVDDKHSKKGVIHSLDGDDYGSAVGIDNGGLTVLGGGEGALAILNNIVNKYAIDGTTYNPQDEVLMLASDADVKVIANTQNQNPSNYKISKFNSDGSVVFPGRVYSNGNGTSIEQQIVDERNRATNRENSIDSRVTSESNRAKGVESSLQSQINTEKSRAQGAESNLSNQINAESNRAKGIENSINANVSKILSQMPTIEVTRDFTTLNGAFNSDGPGKPNTADIVFLNFPTFQIMFLYMWLNGIDIKSPWTRKDVIKIPKSHFKFTKGNLFPMVPSSRVNGSQALDVTFSLATGIVTVSTRENTVGFAGDIGLLAVFHN
ncbi:hypothetical protein SY212_01080 [Ligilactobacillus agilis]|uniref:Uncharacterized protein n=1 Tax=Ligilactobacillus agilis TaxID=1601 RepID=A0A6F9XIR3_9LACO|nr:hypothetical protein [Ligilactobacillus agilis]GET05078.1 hypothetical protein SY212_01080 [Ligilactobacillus agilis]